MSVINTKEDLMKQISGNGMTAVSVAEARGMGGNWNSCGDHVRGFEFHHGESLRVPVATEILLWLKETMLKGKKVYLLHFSAEWTHNGVTEWTWIPVWATRKRARSSQNDPAFLSGHLYQTLLHASNDLARVEMLAGKAWKVSQTTVKEKDDKEKDYELKVWYFDPLA